VTSERARPTFVAVGHVTDDRLLAAGGVEAWTPGGSALYAGLAAAALGARARVVTACAPGAAALARLGAAGVAASVASSEVTTTFENDHRAGTRVQRVRAVAAPIEAVRVDADVVFVCPVAGEVRGAPGAFGARQALVGVGLQGLLRAIAPDGSVTPRALPPEALVGAHVAFASREDLGFDDGVARELAARVAVLVVTDGAAGATVYEAGAPTRVPAAPAREVEPTGAGDLFATAFLLAAARGEAPYQAAIEGACAGAIAVEAVGTEAVRGLATIDARRAAWRRANA
jgi:sugar/nucleoside kinase (ribokinase family)